MRSHLRTALPSRSGIEQGATPRRYYPRFAGRLLVAVVVILGAKLALDRIAKGVAMRATETTAAAAFNVARARVSLFNRRIVLDDLGAVETGGHAVNVVRADRCTMEFAAAPLLRKQAVVEHGRVDGLQINVTMPVAGTAPGNWLARDADAAAINWLVRLNQRLQQQPIPKFESLERTNELTDRWPEACAALTDRVNKLTNRARTLHSSLDAAEANPLRHADFVNALPDRFASLQQEFDALGDDFEGLSILFDEERREIIAARQRDASLLQQDFSIEPIDASSLTAYLLREQLAAPLGELIGWLRWSRRVLPVGKLPPTQPARGEDIVFVGCRPEPNFLIRALELKGVARIGGQTIDLQGILTDVADAPAWHDAPLQLRVAAAGNPKLDLRATIDRTAGTSRDELLLDCWGIELAQFCLRPSSEFELELGRSVGALSVSAITEGEKLRGDLQLVQTGVAIKPVLRGDLAELALAVPLEETLGQLNSVVTRIALDGTLDAPTCTVWSNLGPAVAEALDRAVRHAADTRNQTLLVDVRRQTDEQLANLERQLAEQRIRLTARLALLSGHLETLAARQSQRDRTAGKQIGHRTPTEVLVR